MRRTILAFAAAAATLAACGPEVITLTEADVFPISPGRSIRAFAYLSSGAVAMVERDTDMQVTVGVHSFIGSVARTPFESATNYDIATAGGRAFVVMALNGSATHFAGGLSTASDAGITYAQAVDGTAGGVLGAMGYASDYDTELVTWSTDGVRNFAFYESQTCFGSCLPELGFGLADNFAVTVRDAGCEHWIVVMNHNGRPMGGDALTAIVDTISQTAKFKELNDTTLLVYEQDGNEFTSGHVLTLSSTGARISKEPLPAVLVSTSVFFEPYEDGVLVFSDQTNSLLRANRPWNWTITGQAAVSGSRFSPMPGGAALVDAPGGIGRVSF